MAFIRLQKLIARYGYSSRRKAEDLIESGRVRVNGKYITKLGVKVPSDAIIEVNGKPINRKIPNIYIALNKPPGYLCSKKDLMGRKLIYNLLDNKYKKLGIFSIGRLDYMSEGLILLTNDGTFAHLVSHPSTQIVKGYEVKTGSEISNYLIAEWKKGVYIKGIKYRIKDFKILSPQRVIIYLTEGKNREIRNLLRYINVRIIQLKRISIGNLILGNLPPGNFRELTREEAYGILENSKRDVKNKIDYSN